MERRERLEGQPIERSGSGPVATRIAEHARAAAGGGDDEQLREALEQASPDERSAAAGELVGEPSAYEALHHALREVGIEPPLETTTEATEAT